MNFNGFDATSPSYLTQDIQGNGFSINDIGTVTLVEMSTPPAPTITGSAKYFTDGSGLLNSIDDNGTVLTYLTAGPSGYSDRIVAPNNSCSVIAQNSGTILCDGTLDLNANNIENIAALKASAATPISLENEAGDTKVEVDDTKVEIQVATNAQAQFTTTSSSLLSPDGFSHITLSDSDYVIENASGFVMSADATATTLIQGSDTFSLENSKATSTVPIVLPTNNSDTNCDLQFDDSASTGIYSTSAGNLGISTNGLNTTFLDSGGVKMVLMSGDRPQVLTDIGSRFEVTNPLSLSQNIGFNSTGGRSALFFTRANGTWAAPTQVVSGNVIAMVAAKGYTGAGSYSQSVGTINIVAIENFATLANCGTRIQFATTPIGGATNAECASLTSIGLGIGVVTPTAKLDLSGASGTTFKMVDTNQAAGRILMSDANGVGSWSNLNAVPRGIGQIYYQPAVGAVTAFAFGISGTQYILDPVTTLGTVTNFDMPSNGRLRYTGTNTKTFQFTYSLSYYNNGVAAIQDIYIWPHRNGVNISGAGTRNATLATNNFVNAAGSFTVSMATNDYVELYASNETGTTGINLGTLQISAV